MIYLSSNGRVTITRYCTKEFISNYRVTFEFISTALIKMKFDWNTFQNVKFELNLIGHWYVQILNQDHKIY